jgi:hypothetical protein
VAKGTIASTTAIAVWASGQRWLTPTKTAVTEYPMKAKPCVAPAIVKMFGANPIVSRTTIAAISRAQVNISIRAKVPNMSLGFASIIKAYCGQTKMLLKLGEELSVEVAFVVALII